jgi:endonuclease/exonuclease/phosphatase family metal-dependent hydrolase
VLPPCREVIPANGPLVRWIAPADEGDRKKLRSWCDAVGPLVVQHAGVTPLQPARAVILVSWNMAVGKGDLPALLEQVRRDHPNAEVILLLQEAYRAKTPPAECSAASGRAGALGLPRPPESADILELAQRIGLHAVYAPSMRNGRDCATEPREDRGNAILSSLPLSDFSAIELPFAQERRVAVAALVHDGERRIGVVSTHFDTLRGHRKMAEAISQTMAILGWKDRLIIGGDFNSALPLDGGVREMREHFKELACGSGPTHELGARLDHVFIATGDEPFACRTGSERERHGSDHSPLIAVLRAG